MSQFKYFPDPKTSTEDEAKALRKRLARQYHPDLVGDDGRTMSEINTEYERWVKFKANPPILVPAPNKHADPNAWWTAMVGAVKQVPVEPVPPPPPSPPPARKARAAPPSPAPAPPPSPPPARKARQAPGPRVSVAQREQDDYEAATFTLPDAHGHRAHGVVTILYTSWLGGLTIEAIELRGGHPRHQIRENGVVVYERPATKAWQTERKDLIARASARNYY